MSNNEKPEKNIGCIILFVIAAIGMIIYTIASLDTDTLAGYGSIIMMIVTGGIVYAVIKFIKSHSNSEESNTNHEIDGKGCLKLALIGIGIIGLFALIFNLIATDYELNMWVGGIFLVFIMIIGAIYLWEHMNH